MQKEWQKLKWSEGENWFYFEPTHGYMMTGWQKLKWSGGTNWFYFDKEHGYLYQDLCTTIDNKKYCFNNDGVCTKGSGC